MKHQYLGEHVELQKCLCLIQMHFGTIYHNSPIVLFMYSSKVADADFFPSSEKRRNTTVPSHVSPHGIGRHIAAS